MKKNYTKPQIMFEDFTISTNIAAGCDFKTKLQTSDSECGYDSPSFGAIIFNVDPNCEFIPPTGFDTVCYHNPDPTKDLFNS